MILLSKRSMLAIAAVVDVALHGRGTPVAAKALAERHFLPPRHLEPLLQTLVRNGILRGIRGPRGGYELAKERRRISAGEIVRAAMSDEEMLEGEAGPESKLMISVVGPTVRAAGSAFLGVLDDITIEDLCQQSDQLNVFASSNQPAMDFAI
jgi:Rrf2 family transcriptional regulator, iron-sulfur cluster assembly transcription factor